MRAKLREGTNAGSAQLSLSDEAQIGRATIASTITSRQSRPRIALDILHEPDRFLGGRNRSVNSGRLKTRRLDAAEVNADLLLKFLRSAQAAQAFGDFLAAGTATGQQIEFIGMVIEHLTDRGVMDPALLYEPPFTDIAPTGPEQVFDEDKVALLFDRIDALNASAVA